MGDAARRRPVRRRRPALCSGRDRANFADAPTLVADLGERGLLDGDRVSDAGSALLSRLGAHIKELTAPIWADLPSDDVAAVERVLNLVVGRARTVLSDAAAMTP